MNSASLPKIRLRAMEPEDLDALYHIENDRLLWDVGSTNVPYSRYALHDFIASASGDIYSDRQVRLVIENAGGQTVGLVDLMNFDPSHRRAEVGLVIQQPHRGQGYGRATLVDVHAYAKRVLHLHQLYAIIAVPGGAAQRLFAAMGYKHTATLKEWLYDGEAYHDAAMMQLTL